MKKSNKLNKTNYIADSKLAKYFALLLLTCALYLWAYLTVAHVIWVFPSITQVKVKGIPKVFSKRSYLPRNVSREACMKSCTLVRPSDVINTSPK